MTSPPRRRPSPAVFRRRRLAVLLAVLAVAAVVALLVWQPWSSRAEGTAKPAPPASDPATPTPQPPVTPSPPAATPTPTPTPTPSPSASAGEAIAPCTTADISVLAVTDKDSYGGELPKLSITLSNDGDEPCLMNVGTSTQKFEITSGSDVWWRSTDCQSESSDHVVQIAAGQTVSSATPLEWSRMRSSVDTCDSKDRQKALPGSYHLSVSIGGIEAADTRYFQLR